MKKALITGISGQDGSYLTELLLEQGGYQIAGIVRCGGSDDADLQRIRGSLEHIELYEADITDLPSLIKVLDEARPTEIYNLASQSHVSKSFDEPLLTVQTAGMGALNMFEAVRLTLPEARVYQASSSEMYGNSVDADGFQRETTPMDPRSPYACAKLFAYNIGRNYRSAYGLFISNGILFNHESPRRDPSFVTSKICREAARIKFGLAEKLELGNVDACRDWGHARDYVRAMWMILQHDTPDDFVCATGVTHSVRDVAEYVFARLEIDPARLSIDPGLLRPRDRHTSKGDSSKIRQVLGWKPEYTFETMLDEMIEYWTESVRAEVERGRVTNKVQAK
jgi:GDPmannose 4,6-dehydratase